MEESICHEMVIDLLKRFVCMKWFIISTFSLVLNMMFITLTLKESQEISASISKLILGRERSSGRDIYRYSISLLR